MTTRRFDWKKATLLGGSSLLSLTILCAAGLPGAAAAEDAAPGSATASRGQNSGAVDATLEVITVTGSRIVQDGYEAPTPTTVLGKDQLLAVPVQNLAEQINALPAMVGSTRNNNSTISAGLVGINALNLRNMGTTRTLVLFDGQRLPAATTGGLVDVNIIPDSLVERVEVVTGGASAAWGSDAVTGVVNYVLDKDFTGVRGDASAGVTTYGDDKSYRLSLAAATDFANGRGHVMLSGEHAWNEGINGIPRDWYVGAKQFNNPDYTPTNGQPQILVRRGVGYTNVAPGAIITPNPANGPLAGIYFTDGGEVRVLNYGSPRNGNWMQGGDWKVTDFGDGPQALSNPTSRQNVFARADYDVTEHVNFFAQLSFSETVIDMITTPMFNFGGLYINRDNPFLPESVAAAMDANGLTRVEIGTWNKDIGGLPYYADRTLKRYVVGAEGDFNALGREWTWDLTFTQNVSQIWQHLYIPNNAKYREALDAVMGPNGAPICRSTVTDPGNGCVPFNILGVGTASPGALGYVNGEAWLDQEVTQDIVDANISGAPLSTWAGPVLMAAGFTHRREEGSGDSDAVSKTNGYWAGNYKAINGSYEVTEGYAEVAVPLAADAPFAKSLDLNGAVRWTNYSTSGDVTTWKIGATWSPIEDITFRTTRSRDIRAGNLADLFQPGQTLTATFSDPYFADRRSYTIFYTRLGNVDIKPEIGDTVDVGVVVEPRFVPGFTASADYWDIALEDAIATLSNATLVNECLTGATELCQYVHRDADGYITNLDLVPVNLAEQNARGVDVEASYRFDLGPGEVSLRALYTRYLEASSNTGIQGAQWSDDLGVGTPDWRSLVSATYELDKFSATLSARSMSDRVFSNNNIECTSGCPASTTLHPTIEDNDVEGYTYLDFGAKYDVTDTLQAYVSITNLMNEDPAIIANGQGIGSQQRNLNETFYDLLGRQFRVGVRFEF
jgi:outer membrane receptor protein involved in Fe transport